MRALGQYFKYINLSRFYFYKSFNFIEPYYAGAPYRIGNIKPIIKLMYFYSKGTCKSKQDQAYYLNLIISFLTKIY